MAAFRKAAPLVVSVFEKYKAPAKAKAPRRKPGLWFSKMKVEVQTITKRQRLPCFVCGTIPQTRRLFVHHGAGRNGWTEVYCIDCGMQWFTNKETEARRGRLFLLGGTSSIRFDNVFHDAKGNSYPDPYAAFKVRQKEKAKAKAQAENDQSS